MAAASFTGATNAEGFVTFVRDSLAPVLKGIATARASVTLTDANNFMARCGYATKRRRPLRPRVLRPV